MREKINRLAKGIVDFQNPEFLIVPEKLNEHIPAQEISRGEINLASSNGLSMKGLVYSSHYRVKVLTEAFGGLRSRILYEIDTTYLENGDQIRGSFFLVTNGGEKEIPFVFQVQSGTSGQALGNLKTARDFSNLAKRDRETALRLFEYQDFIDAPFMQDMHIRAVYDGLKGRTNRENLLEEFLTALQVKEAVTITVEDRDRVYRTPGTSIVDTIEIRKNTWGYVNIQLEAEGGFLELVRSQVREEDFDGDVCQIGYRIHPRFLHKGENQGIIRLKTVREQVTVQIRVEGAETKEEGDLDYLEWKKGYGTYLSLRQDYESGKYEESLILGRMKKQLDTLKGFKPQDAKTSLLSAECCILLEQKDQAVMLLDEIRDQVLSSRRDDVELYCFFQYLSLELNPNQSQKDSLIRLVRKYLTESHSYPYLFFLRLKLEPEMEENPAMTLAEMAELYTWGFRSPFLYQKACLILSAHPDLLRGMTQFELQVLSYGVAHGLVREGLAEKAARAAGTARYYNTLYSRLLVRLYQDYPKRHLLEAICCMRIKGDCRSPEDFAWYELALKEQINLTRLYEYYLYALPEDFNHSLPKEVLLYFSYSQELDSHTKAVLYKNILTYLNPSSDLYKAYERDMEQFAMEQLFAANIDSNLAVLYDKMIYRDVIDVPVAKILPSILRSYRISCRNPEMLYVIVRYEETLDEDIFLLRDGVAYVPLFLDKSVILFQDGYGNRYTNIRYIKTAVMDKPDLEKRCFEVYPEHPMLCLRACRQIGEQGAETDEEAALLERALKDLNLNPLYEKQLLSKSIAYYQKKASQEEKGGADLSYLLMLDKDHISREERTGICDTLIRQNYLMEAYDMMKKYGITEISTGRRLKLCTKMILQKLFDEDEFLSWLAVQVFDAGSADSVILDYLCQYYNGPAGTMYRILMQGVEYHVDTYDMEERLLAQMLFSGCQERMDAVFDLYASRKKTSDSIVKAYFAVKCTDYFYRDAQPEGRIFEYLEGLVKNTPDRERIPTIYLLSLTRFYSDQGRLSDEQKILCQQVVDFLLDAGLVFPYFKKLGRFVQIPKDIMDKVMIQYKGDRDSRIVLRVRVLPDEEEFHSEEMHRVYQGIFVMEKVLFDGETLEYRVYEYKNGNSVLMAQGKKQCQVISAQAESGQGKDSRFSCLNEMSKCIANGEEAGLKKKMKEYLIKNATVEELFSLP